MTERPPQPGRIRDPIHRWPIDERPPVWIHVDGTQHAGHEHAHAENGRARLVAWGADYQWVRAEHVTPRTP